MMQRLCFLLKNASEKSSMILSCLEVVLLQRNVAGATSVYVILDISKGMAAEACNGIAILVMYKNRQIVLKC